MDIAFPSGDNKSCVRNKSCKNQPRNSWAWRPRSGDKPKRNRRQLAGHFDPRKGNTREMFGRLPTSGGVKSHQVGKCHITPIIPHLFTNDKKSHQQPKVTSQNQNSPGTPTITGGLLQKIRPFPDHLPNGNHRITALAIMCYV